MDNSKLIAVNGKENSLLTNSNNVSNLKNSNILNNSMASPQRLFFDAIYSTNVNEIKDYFQNYNYKPWEWIDEESYTCLHKACFMNLSLIVKLIFECLKLRDISDFELKNFINIGSLNGSRAIHLASYRGNIDILEILIQNGADIYSTNDRGLNVMHMAAQGDQPATLIYFREKYALDLETRDIPGNSPLHWACYMGSDNFLSFFLSYNQGNVKNFNINIKEDNGLSPLHLAVISEKTKIIKKLIHKGAQKDILDKKNRTPYTLALEKHKYTIVELLREDNSICDKNCLLKQKLEKTERSSINMVVFIILHLVIESATFLLIFPHFEWPTLSTVYIATFISLMINFILLTCSDPGYVIHHQISLNSSKPSLNSHQVLLDLIEKRIPIDEYCPHCVVIKHDKNKVKHCYYCNRCIKEYDHHCYWVNNCIGVNNINLFLCFVSIVVFNLFLHIFIGFYGIFRKSDENMTAQFNSNRTTYNNTININTDVNFNGYFPHRIKFFDYIHLYDKDFKLLFCSSLIIICVCFVIPVSILWIKNIQNFFLKVKKKRKEDDLKKINGKSNNEANHLEIEANNLLSENIIKTNS